MVWNTQKNHETYKAKENFLAAELNSAISSAETKLNRKLTSEEHALACDLYKAGQEAALQAQSHYKQAPTCEH